MLKTRLKRIAIETERALDTLIAIRAAVINLSDDDLLDFADIFASGDPTPLRMMAKTEMARRGLSL